jgi:hypothetical protein
MEFFSVVDLLLLLQDSVITNPTIALVSPKPENSSYFFIFATLVTEGSTWFLSKETSDLSILSI